MYITQIFNQSHDNFSKLEKLKLLIDFVKIQKKIKTQEDKDFLDNVLVDLFKDKTREIAFSKIIKNLYLNMKNDINNNILFIIDLIIENGLSINWSHKYVKLERPHNTATLLFQAIAKCNIGTKEKIRYYKKLFNFINKSSDINHIKFIDLENNSAQVDLISYFIYWPDLYKNYESFIYHLIKNNKKYQINLLECDVLVYILSNNETFSSLRNQLVKVIPLEMLKQQHQSLNKFFDTSDNLYSHLLRNINDDGMNKLLIKRVDLLDSLTLNVNMILENTHLSLQMKKKILNLHLLRDKTTKISLSSLFYGIFLNDESLENNEKFINYCQNNFNSHLIDEHNNNLLHIFCYSLTKKIQASHVIFILLKNYIIPLTKKDNKNKSGFYPIHYTVNYHQKNEAIKNQIKQSLQYLKNKIDFNAKSKNGNTVLHLAIRMSRDIDYIETLMASGASLLIQNKTGKTPFDYITHHKNYNQIKDELTSLYEKEKLEIKLINQENRQIINKI